MRVVNATFGPEGDPNGAAEALDVVALAEPTVVSHGASEAVQDAISGTGIGAAVGGAAGLAIGALALAVPGVLPVVGLLAAASAGTLSGGTLGAAAGAAIGAAREPEGGTVEAETLVSVVVDGDAEAREAERLIEAHGGVPADDDALRDAGWVE